MNVPISIIPALLWGAPWMVGMAFGLISYRGLKSNGLSLSLAAFAALFTLHVTSSILLMFPDDNGALSQPLAGIFLIFQFGRAGTVVLLALAFFRLLKEIGAAAPDR